MKRELNLTPELKLKQWGPGPWVDEPDFVTFEHLGIMCTVERVAVWDGKEEDRLALGHLCGYCLIPKNSKNAGGDYIAHGGITYLDLTDEGTFIGFDCAHYQDLVPSIAKEYPSLALRGEIGIEYRTVEFATEECKKLAEQIAAKKDKV